MAKLYFRYGVMGSSKTANALMTRFNYEERGMKVWLLKPSADQRDGIHMLHSRIGLEAPAEVITPEDDIYALYTQRDHPDVVITDLMLPGVPGEEIVRAIRGADSALPIIVISARITAADKISLLQAGADDYLTKPFDLDELQARIEVQRRHHAERAHAGTAASATDAGGYQRLLAFRRWELDPDGRVFRVDGEEVALTRTEFNILELLMARPQKVFTKQELFELAWGEPYSVEDSTVNVHVSNLRRKLKPTDTDGYLQTVWGMGYKLHNA